MNTENFEIEYNKKQYPVCLMTADTKSSEWGIILTHGGGGDMNTNQLSLFSEHLVKAGFLVLRFTCKGLNLVHRSNVYLHIMKYLKTSSYNVKNCLLAGRSMGSRAAVEVANRVQSDASLNEFVKGVVCISYPLYPPKDPQKLRDGPIVELAKPVLFISGTKDEMCDQQLLVSTLVDKKNVDYFWVDGAPHSLEVKGCQLVETIIKASNKIKAWSQSICSSNDSSEDTCIKTTDITIKPMSKKRKAKTIKKASKKVKE